MSPKNEYLFGLVGQKNLLAPFGGSVYTFTCNLWWVKKNTCPLWWVIFQIFTRTICLNIKLHLYPLVKYITIFMLLNSTKMAISVDVPANTTHYNSFSKLYYVPTCGHFQGNSETKVVTDKKNIIGGPFNTDMTR